MGLVRLHSALAPLLPRLAELVGVKALVVEAGLQSLSGGYGELVRLRVEGGAYKSAILKWARPPLQESSSASHLRKCRSFDVEASFYREYSGRCDPACRVPRLLAEDKRDGEWLLLLEDLDAAGYPGRTRAPRARELSACLDWLAAFHGRFFGVEPQGLWPVGCYWHLATRAEELAVLTPAQQARARQIDRRLSESRYQTLVHGDAKPANFCFSPQGDGVAAVDFQYVGAGVGVRDVAYLLHGLTPEQSERALDHYFSRLSSWLAPLWDADAVEREWRELYPIALEDFERFLVGFHRRH